MNVFSGVSNRIGGVSAQTGLCLTRQGNSFHQKGLGIISLLMEPLRVRNVERRGPKKISDMRVITHFALLSVL